MKINMGAISKFSERQMDRYEHVCKVGGFGCRSCGKYVSVKDIETQEFKDQLDLQEMFISMMCYQCQDEVFTMLEEAENNVDDYNDEDSETADGKRKQEKQWEQFDVNELI
jgi:transcription elongation factor Elf1